MKVLFWLIVALLTLINFHYAGDDWPIRWDGRIIAAVAGTLLLIGLMIALFNRVQDILIARRIIGERVSTAYDIFPLILLIPFAIGFGFRGEDASFAWGHGPVHNGLIFLALLGLIYLYRVVVLLNKVRNHYQSATPR